MTMPMPYTGPGDDDDPLEQLKRIKAAEDADPLAQLKRLTPTQPPQKAVPVESLRLSIPKESTRAPSESTRALSRERPDATGDFQSLAPAVAANVLSAAQVLPGMEWLEARAGSLGSKLTSHPLSYQESLDALRSQTDAIPGPIKAAGRIAAGAPLLSVIPAGVSPALVGGALGAADEIAAADTDRSVGTRAKRAVVAGATGAAMGKLIDMGVGAVRAYKSPGSADALKALKQLRENESAPLFASALQQGAAASGGAPYATPEVQAFLAKPDIKEIVNGLLETREFAGKTADSPEVLDAIYKTLSDQSAQVKRGLDAATPNRPNIGRYRQRDIRAAKDEALAAMDAQGMTDYRPAVQAYAQGSQNIDALRRGQDAVRAGLSKSVPTGKNLDRTTVDAYQDFIERATPAQRQAAEAGILGASKRAVSGQTPLRAIAALAKTPGLLRTTSSSTQRAVDALIRAGLLGANAAVKP